MVNLVDDFLLNMYSIHLPLITGSVFKNSRNAVDCGYDKRPSQKNSKTPMSLETSRILRAKILLVENLADYLLITDSVCGLRADMARG